MFSEVKKGGLSLFLLVGEILFFFLAESNAELCDWHDTNAVKYMSISHRHGRIDSSVMEGHYAFFVCHYQFAEHILENGRSSNEPK